MTTPRFLYFDLGNVLLHFDQRRAIGQMAEVLGTTGDKLQAFFREFDYGTRLELGTIDFATVHRHLTAEFRSTGSLAALQVACSDMFEINPPLLPLLARLADTGIPLGILSNTSDPHWAWVASGRFRIIRDLFRVYALSFRLGVMKPDPRIFEQSAKLAGFPPNEIFFTDDRPENVAAAREAGMQAVQFTTPSKLATELRATGLKFYF